MVRVTGVEPARREAREPKSRMSANSIIPAYAIPGGAAAPNPLPSYHIAEVDVNEKTNIGD